MIERLLFDRIDAKSRGTSVGRKHHLVVLAHAHETRAALALVQPAIARTQVALQPAVREPMPPAADVGSLSHRAQRRRSASRHSSTVYRFTRQRPLTALCA